MSDNENTETIIPAEKYIKELQKTISKRVKLYGNDDLAVMKNYHTLCKLLNQQGLLELQKSNFDTCLDYLKRAEQCTMYVPEMKVQTFNNLACYYRKIGKTRIALTYLQQALNIQLQLDNDTNQLSDIYLNFCAVLSQLDKHEEAIQHIYLSIIMLQHQLLIQFLDGAFSFPLSEHYNFKSNECPSRQSSVQFANSIKSNVTENKKTLERASVLVVAYHNLGVEMEHLKKTIESKRIFLCASQLSELCLPTDHQLRLTLQEITKTYNKQQIPYSLKPLLPKLNQRQLDIKQFQKSISPRNRMKYSVPLNNMETCRLEKKRINSLNKTEIVKENKDQNEQIDMQTREKNNQTTIF